MNAKCLCLTVCGLFESKLVIISADCVIVLMQARCLTWYLPELKSLCNSISAERFFCLNNFTVKLLD